MKGFLVLLILVVSVGGFSQGKEKISIKKDVITVNKVEWSRHSRVGGKYFLGILNGGEDFLSYIIDSYMTGRYDGNGNPIKESYLILEFYDKNLSEKLAGEFELKTGLKEMIRLLFKHEVIKDNKLNQEGALEFKTRYAQDITGRRFLTK